MKIGDNSIFIIIYVRTVPNKIKLIHSNLKWHIL